MSLLITGGTGYIGKKLVQQLEKKYSPIHSVGIEELNLLNYTDTLNFLKDNNTTEVIHLGWSMENENKAIYDNTEALINLIRACELVEVKKFIFASTNNVYGTSVDSCLFSENDIPKPDDANKYGISKYIGEKLINYTLKEKSCIIRIADVYGPGQTHGNLIKAIISNVENKENLKLYGKGERERDYIYIDDVIRGIEFIYENNLTGTYNLGTGVGTNIKKIVDIVLKICQNMIGFDYVKVEKEDTSKVILNIEKLKKLGFYSNITIEEGLKKILRKEG